MEFIYEVQKSFRRSISIHVSDDKKIIVKAPFGMQVHTIENFLREKRSWILKQFERIGDQEKAVQAAGYFSEEELKECRKRAKKIIPERVEHYAKLMDVSYGRISIRLQKSRWGSCSSKGNLNFNCLLVLMPSEILDSVVVHELCHRKQMNHSRKFYDEVLRIFPDYRKCEKWLKQNGGIYFKRIRNKC